MSKKTVKKTVKVGKKVKKTSSKAKVWFGLFSFLIALAVGGTGIYYHQVADTENEQVELMIEELKTSLPTQTTNNLTLPNRLSGYPNVAISWVSSNPAVISDDGQVFRPLYATGNKTIRLTATFIIKPDDALAQTFFTTFGISPLQESFTVKVICLPMTNEEKVTQALASLYVPSKTVSDIGLTTQLVEDDAMTITWSSANDTIISATGNVLGLGSTSLTATVTLGSTSEQKTFPIEVVSAYDDIVYTNPNLSEISSGTYANVWNSDNLAFNQAIIAEANNQK
ncbi:MAG TPA: hypothetical protein PK087_02130, partial [Bacilli bacterium]|nr:hypothetical protein [Bacilli bacterium]